MTGVRAAHAQATAFRRKPYSRSFDGHRLNTQREMAVHNAHFIADRYSFDQNARVPISDARMLPGSILFGGAIR